MKNFLLATRPKTLVVSFLPPLVCYFYGLTLNSDIPLYLPFCTILSAVLIQVATNFFNDLIDHQKGSDKIRLGPKRVTASGLVSEKKIKLWAYGSTLGAFLLAIPLFFRGGPVIVILGLISLYLTYGYTGGVVSLAYRGLGELFVFLFFGLFACMGSIYIYTLEVPSYGVLMATQFGLLAVTFIGINNLRDRDLDKLVHKRTLATRMGELTYRHLIVLTILLPYVLVFFFSAGFSLRYFALLIGLPFSLMVYQKSGANLNVGLKFAGIHMILFSLLTILDIRNGHIF